MNIDQSTDATPIFFMHIAKTAGSYVNEVFRDAFGDDKVLLHAENRIGSTHDLMSVLSEGRRFISGHIMNSLWHEITRDIDRSFFTFAVVRDPIEHLASHLLWLDHYSLDQYRAEFLMLDRFHRQLVAMIAATDLSDVRKLDDLITNLPPLGMRLFDNCQSRYFLPNGYRGVANYYPLTLSVAPQLNEAISKFDAILTQDRLEQGLADVSKSLGIPLSLLQQKINPSKSERSIDLTNPVIRQILGKRLTVDQWLWRRVSVERENRLS